MGLALRSLGDRTQLLSFLVAQLRQKVGPGGSEGRSGHTSIRQAQVGVRQTQVGVRQVKLGSGCPKLGVMPSWLWVAQSIWLPRKPGQWAVRTPSLAWRCGWDSECPVTLSLPLINLLPPGCGN